MRVFEFGLPRWADIFGLGYVGVHLFLLLSGFCLSWAYVGDAPRPFKGREFLIRRATRILPAYYVAMVISAILAAPHTSALGLTWQLLTHATMTHNLFRSTVLGLNGPFWSLALECQLYVLFPLMLLGLLRIGSVGTLALVLLLQTVFRVVALWYRLQREHLRSPLERGWATLRVLLGDVRRGPGCTRLFESHSDHKSLGLAPRHRNGFHRRTMVR